MITPEKQMDDFFNKYWELAKKLAQNKDEELYKKNYSLFYPGREDYARQQARKMGQKRFTISFFLLWASRVPKIKNYLNLLKNRHLDCYENFKAIYCF